MKKIIHIASSYPPALGGMEKVVQILARSQAAAGLDVSVISSDRNAKGQLVAEDFPVNRLRSYWVASTTIMPALLLKLLRIKRGTIVHLHITQAYTPETVWLVSRIKRFAYIAHIHLDIPPSTRLGMLLVPYKRFILRRVLHAAAYIVVFSPEQKKAVITQYGLPSEQVKVIPNGVEADFYYNKPRRLHQTTRLLFVGRLSFQKNLSLLMEALKGVSAQFTTTLVGDGELRNELKQQAKHLGLHHITFINQTMGKDLLKYYQQADIFVLPSEREGMPLVLLEALAMGLPIIATDVTGNHDIVQDGVNGFLSPLGDPIAFRTALLKVQSDPILYERLSTASREMAVRYSWPKITSKFERLYATAYK